MKTLVISIATLMMLPVMGWGQLYLIVGTPTYNQADGYAVVLSRLDDSGKIRQVIELMPKKSGVEWLGISYDLHKALLLPKDADCPLVVLDLDKAEVVKKCTAPPTTGVSLVGQFLTDVPGRGATFEMYLSGADPRAAYLTAMDLNPALLCDQSFFRAPMSDIQYLVAHGTAGVGDRLSVEGKDARLDSDGELALPVPDAAFSLGVKVPAGVRKGVEGAVPLIVINNSHLMAIRLGSDSEGQVPPRLAAFRKRDKTWHLIPVQGPLNSRGFGQFVATVEAKFRKDSPRILPLGEAAKRPPVEPSTGRAGWRTYETALGPNLAESFEDAVETYTGRLHLFNIETERLDTIATRQANSEILLVEDGTVYYRVNDQLYSAPVTDKGIGTARLLATDEVIRDAHWAFIKH